MFLTILVPQYSMGRALSERSAAASSLGTLRSRLGEEMEMVHVYIMNMVGTTSISLKLASLKLASLEWISQTSTPQSSGLSSTAVDYWGVHFSESAREPFALDSQRIKVPRPS